MQLPPLRMTRFFRQLAGAVHSRSISYLEAEKKFTPSATFVEGMNALMNRHNADMPSFWRAEPPLQLRDTYYDSRSLLSRRGLWIRFRTSSIPSPEALPNDQSSNGEWNAKVRLGGDFLNSSFEELRGEPNVRKTLHEHFPHLSLEDLEVMADMHTIRQTWTLHKPVKALSTRGHGKDGEQSFSIVVDYVQLAGVLEDRYDSKFEHKVGEVEMTRSFLPHENVGSGSETKEAALVAMHEQIQCFMTNHPVLFSPVRPKGKLSAYFEWTKTSR